MLDDKHMQEAVDAYTEKRQQMTPRKAAAHVIQAFGVSAGDLARAVADSGGLLVQQPSRGFAPGISTYRAVA